MKLKRGGIGVDKDWCPVEIRPKKMFFADSFRTFYRDAHGKPASKDKAKFGVTAGCIRTKDITWFPERWPRGKTKFGKKFKSKGVCWNKKRQKKESIHGHRILLPPGEDFTPKTGKFKGKTVECPKRKRH